MDIAAARPRPIPVFAEMGSVNPVFLGPKTLARTGEQIAAGLSGSVCMGTGQFCTSPGLAVLVEDSAFEQHMKRAMDAVPSIDLSAMFPTKPSQTMTSARFSNSSLGST